MYFIVLSRWGFYIVDEFVLSRVIIICLSLAILILMEFFIF